MSQFILMAEDDPDIQLVARMALKKGGFRVAVVNNGRKLLERVTEERPDVIADIPVIFMTTKSQGLERSHGLASGALGYIIKPFDALTLGDRIREILG
jgi:DNA-binding response OmpR family regulator